jgi:hypothetical protein
VRLILEFSGDLRFAVRTFRRHKAFATMAVVTLALGLGANIAAFSAFDAVLMRDLPVEKAEELVTFDWLRTDDSMVAGYSGYGSPGPIAGTGIRTSFSPITFQRFRESSGTLSDMEHLEYPSQQRRRGHADCLRFRRPAYELGFDTRC